MKITFYGIGYVGLVQATVFADAGHHVCCVDIDQEKIDKLNSGIIPIFEPHLSKLVDKNLNEGRLNFTTDAQYGVEFSKLQFIAVGTPADEDGAADLKYVLKVAETIALHMNEPKIIINKSTVPVGTAEKVKLCVSEVLKGAQKDLDFSVVSNPEFLKEGDAVADCKKPDRIVIGTDSKDVESTLRELYSSFNRNHDKIIVMDIKSAELTKYAANCMLATKISFMNEVANISKLVGADIEEVRRGIGSDSRIGYDFIYPGIGYGGSCFPKDVRALIKTSQDNGYDAEILKSVEKVNYGQKIKLYEMICEYYEVEEGAIDPLLGKTFAVWGLSFKPKTDDMREAPSRVLMEALWSAGAKVRAYDPEAAEEATRIYGRRPEFEVVTSKEDAVRGSNALIICTEWESFRAPDFDMLKSELFEPLIFDGRNLFDPRALADQGFIYYSIGRTMKLNQPE